MKKSKKRIWRGIIISIVSAILIAAILTKVIYDATFPRYEGGSAIPAALQELVEHRKQVKFKSGENQLVGYLYEGERDGLILLVPGYNAGADDYLWQIRDLTARGWGVFAFDPTGYCRSEGDSAIGFSQILEDLEAAINYMEQKERFGYQNLWLLGHSRGGYAACGMLDEGYDLAGVIAVSGVNSCMDAVMQPAADAVGGLAYANYPMLYLYQSALFGSEAVETDAAAEIADASVPVLIVQGAQDEQFPIDRYSIYAHREEIPAGKAEYYLCDVPGQDGHTDLLFDADGSANDQLMERIHQFMTQAEKGD